MKVILTCLILSAAVSPARTEALDDGIVDVRVEGNILEATIQASNVLSAELTVGFENVVGLSAESLGLSAVVLNPLDAVLLQRLGNAAISIPRGFPVLVRIEPPAAGGLSFSGIATIELYTHNLQYEADTPLRLFSAPAGGAFVDVTSFIGNGSYRTGGRKGTFSEFLIVADTRSLSSVIDEKFARLEGLLESHGAEISPTLLGDLTGLVDAARTAYASGVTVAAIQYTETFGSTVAEHGGDGMPDVWQSSRDLANVAGELRAAADTLRFSLTLASNSP
ncbi:MAG: DUF6689 family protein [Gammaproteobacteria bacterium]